MNRYLIFPSLLILFFSAQLISQEEQTSQPDFSFGVSIGTVTLDEEVYNSLRFLPEFSYGKLGAGLDIDFRFTLKNDDQGDPQFRVFRKDWYYKDGGSSSEYLNLYLAKFSYIRWGEERDPLYIRLGSLGSTTLGTGFIMGGYANTLQLPEKRVFGGQFSLKGKLFDFPYLGAQGMVSNISAMDLIGARLYGYPVTRLSQNYILKNLEIGTSLYIDRDPFIYLTDEDDNGYYDAYENSFYPSDYDPDRVQITGFDFIAPLYSGELSSLVLMGDIVFQGPSDPKTGSMLGAGGSILFFRYTGQLRFMGDDFQPVYFDNPYDLLRSDKYTIYHNEDDPILDAAVGYLASLGVSLLQDSLIFNVSLEGPFSNPGDNPYRDPRLKGIFALQPGTIDLVDFNFWYDKMFINNPDDLVNQENALIGGQVNVHMAPAVITFQMDAKYEPGDSSDWNVTSQIRTGIQF